MFHKSRSGANLLPVLITAIALATLGMAFVARFSSGIKNSGATANDAFAELTENIKVSTGLGEEDENTPAGPHVPDYESPLYDQYHNIVMAPGNTEAASFNIQFTDETRSDGYEISFLYDDGSGTTQTLSSRVYDNSAHKDFVITGYQAEDLGASGWGHLPNYVQIIPFKYDENGDKLYGTPDISPMDITWYF